MGESQIFQIDSIDANSFYEEFGFAHFRSSSSSFISVIDKCFRYYSSAKKNNSSKNIAFRSADGRPKHIIDIFRDKNSDSFKIYSSNVVKTLIKKNVSPNERFIFTHSKMSFKQVQSDSIWQPHQDNGYKTQGDIREGFAIFICLEDMNEENGCLQVWPGSNKLGLLPHSRIIEDKKTGDNQFYVEDVPNNITPKSIIAKKGDIIIFSSNTIHHSLSSKSTSNRLSLIAEIECFNSLKLDDYGKVPIFSIGSIRLFEKIMLLLKIMYSPYFYWRIIKKNRVLAMLIRKLRYSFN